MPPTKRTEPRGRFAPDAYHDFIGFEVAQPLLDRVFRESYGLELASVLDNEPQAIGSYRHAISSTIPKATRVAWALVAAGPSRKTALEEAEGQPTMIYVVLPGEPTRVAIGAVFSYYEFPEPIDGRMTDEQWQALVEAGTNPPAPDWTKLFIAP